MDRTPIHNWTILHISIGCPLLQYRYLDPAQTHPDTHLDWTPVHYNYSVSIMTSTFRSMLASLRHKDRILNNSSESVVCRLC